MSMTREEAIKQIEKLKSYCEYIADSDESGAYLFDLDGQALDLALSALRPTTREQIENVWKGEWIAYLDGEHIIPGRYYSCSKCGGRGHLSKRNFCDFCGAPMTDAAVDMVMKKLEEMKVE